jgi:hypothetical protein
MSSIEIVIGTTERDALGHAVNVGLTATCGVRSDDVVLLPPAL